MALYLQLLDTLHENGILAPHPMATRSKRSQAADASALNDDMIPLIIASHPNLTLSYKTMAALDPLNRTESSHQHRFRKWRARANEIKDEYNAIMGEGAAKHAAAKGPVKPPMVNVRRSKPKANDMNEEELGPESEDANIQQEMTLPSDAASAEALAAAGSLDSIENSVVQGLHHPKKRNQQLAELATSESPAKKPKLPNFTKKGTARTVKSEVKSGDSHLEETDEASANRDKGKTYRPKTRKTKKKATGQVYPGYQIPYMV